jgi:hypothetical protein
LAVPKQTDVINTAALPFYATLGADCKHRFWQQNAFELAAFKRDSWHKSCMSAFLVFLTYFLFHSLYRIRLRNPHLRLHIFPKCFSLPLPTSLRYLFLTFKLVLYLAIFTSGIFMLFRLFNLRELFRTWHQLRYPGQPLDEDQWGFGQVLALFVWGGLVWEVALWGATFWPKRGRSAGEEWLEVGEGVEARRARDGDAEQEVGFDFGFERERDKGEGSHAMIFENRI